VAKSNNDRRNWLTLLIVTTINLTGFLAVNALFGFAVALTAEIIVIFPVAVTIARKLTGRHLMREVFGDSI
jgi:hypothetical protein